MFPPQIPQYVRSDIFSVKTLYLDLLKTLINLNVGLHRVHV